jgi:ankyrin
MRADRSQLVVGCMVVLVLFAVSVRAAGRLELLQAVKNHDRETVQRLLARGVDVNERAGDGATALHWAALGGNVDIAERLIRAGAAVNAADEHGVTPLALACTDGSAAMVATLLHASANADAATSMGETALMTCAATGSVEAVAALLGHGAKSINATEGSRGQTALMWAAARRHPQVVRLLLEHGANVHARSMVSYLHVPTNAYASNLFSRDTVDMPMGGFTPLLFAVRHGDIASARLLLDAGAKVNDAAADEISPLVLAAHSGHTPMVAFLLDRGAEVNGARVGYSALHAAVLRGDIDMIGTLLARGADPNARLTKGTRVPRDTNQWVLSSYLAGATPFLLAAKYAEPAIMRLLVAHGADPLLPTNDGTTPLMMAAGMTWGWNMEDRRDRAVPAEVVHAMHENEARTLEVVQLALDLGGDVNAANAAGDTALHAATFKGFETVVKHLVNRGGDMGRKNNRGKAPELCYEQSKVVRCVYEAGG